MKSSHESPHGLCGRRWTDVLPVFGSWLLVCAALWTLLARGEGWPFGLPVVLLASALAVRLRVPPLQLQLRYLPSFVIFFLRSTLTGATDVAIRSIHPRLPIAPAWVRYRFAETDPRVRLLASAIVGVFPGTLASRIEDDELHVHVLDEHTDWRSTVAELESRLAQLMPPGKARGR